MYAYLLRKESFEVVERDDGYFDISGGAEAYFAPFAKWARFEREGMRYVRGRVLDLGCGAGRVALHLQRRGHKVVGIDISPMAVKTARLRGVRDARVLSITEVSPRLGRFDTLVMYGNNFGLLGGPKRARWLLRRFKRITAPGARIVAVSNDPYKTTMKAHREYQVHNRRRGRMPGALRIRVRFLKYATPWFDYLLVSRKEMEDLLEGTGWRVARYLSSGGSTYAAVIGREG